MQPQSYEGVGRGCFNQAPCVMISARTFFLPESMVVDCDAEILNIKVLIETLRYQSCFNLLFTCNEIIISCQQWK